MAKGNSIENAIVIDAPDSFTGIDEERNYIDALCDYLNTSVHSFEQKLIFESGKPYDPLR